MPEGPEVRIITEWISSKIKNKYLMGIFHDRNSKFFKYGIKRISLINSSYPLFIEDVYCKGKQIYMKLCDSDGITYYIYNHLNMEGHWRLDRKWYSGNEFNDGTTHSNLWLKIGSSNDNGLFKNVFDLFFDDTRKFGKFEIFTEEQYNERIQKEIGPDLLNEEIKWEDYYTRTKLIVGKVKTLNVADFLLNQKYFCGIGNYLKSEILYLARINPFRGIKSLNDTELYNLYNATIKLIKQAYQMGGMSIKTFKNPFIYIDKINNNYTGFIPCVYGKTQDNYGNQVIMGKSERKKDDRTTYWVPSLQL